MKRRYREIPTSWYGDPEFIPWVRYGNGVANLLCTEHIDTVESPSPPTGTAIQWWACSADRSISKKINGDWQVVGTYGSYSYLLKEML